MGWFLIGALAAFGLVCAVWTLWGFCLSPDEGRLIYVGPAPIEFARRYLWLKEMGLIRCRLSVAEPDGETERWLHDRGIESWSREEIAGGQMGETEFDGRTGDIAGNHRRGGFSEL